MTYVQCWVAKMSICKLSKDEAIAHTSFEVFGKKERKNDDWFEVGLTEIKPAIEEKRAAIMERNRNPSKKTEAALKAARINAQCIARKCANNYWRNLCNSIQTSAELGNSRGIYKGMKRALRQVLPRQLISSRKMVKPSRSQTSNWKEHYSELYSKESVVWDAAIKNTTQMPTMDELDTPLTIEELNKAINSLSSDKAPGNDGIPPEIVKAGKDSSLINRFHELLIDWWEEGTVPQDMKDAKIVTLYKNRGDNSDCNKFRWISLLSITGKVFARVVLNRLQKHTERVCPESQCGFRASKSTIADLELQNQLLTYFSLSDSFKRSAVKRDATST